MKSDQIFISYLKLPCDYLLHSINFYKLIVLVSLLHPPPALTMHKSYMKLFQITIGFSVSNWLVVCYYDFIFQNCELSCFPVHCMHYFTAKLRRLFCCWKPLANSFCFDWTTGYQQGMTKNQQQQKNHFPFRRLKLSWNTEFLLDGKEFLIM